MKLRNRIRKWLGLDSDYDILYDQFKRATLDIVILRNQLVALDTTLNAVAERFNDMEAQFMKSPITFRLAQVNSSLKILTSFANELQRDIENVEARTKAPR